MKAKILLAIVALSYVPLAFGGSGAIYPNEKVAQFVVAKLDVSSLPAVFRPAKEKGKVTLSDYGFTTQLVGEHEAILKAPDGSGSLTLKVLDQRSSGIFVCAAATGPNGGSKTQTVLLLKRKDSDGMLTGHESLREYAACPMVPSNDEFNIP